MRVIDREIVSETRVPRDELAAVAARERAAVEVRAARYLARWPRRPLDGRVAVVVDDGVATGSTARAACHGPGPVMVGLDHSPASQAAAEFAFGAAELRKVPSLAVCALADAPGMLGGAREMEAVSARRSPCWRKNIPMSRCCGMPPGGTRASVSGNTSPASAPLLAITLVPAPARVIVTIIAALAALTGTGAVSAALGRAPRLPAVVTAGRRRAWVASRASQSGTNGSSTCPGHGIAWRPRR